LRGVLGSDLVAHRSDWRVIDNPFSVDSDPILLVPALLPDVGIFHAVAADPFGNVYVGRRRELATIAHAARRTLVTVERLVPGDLLEDEATAAGTISGVYVEATALAPRGAWPSGLLDEYDTDAAHLANYARLARTDAGFAEYLARHVPAETALA
jgi:glutaconate CoA-transferase, subunit A